MVITKGEALEPDRQIVSPITIQPFDRKVLKCQMTIRASNICERSNVQGVRASNIGERSNVLARPRLGGRPRFCHERFSALQKNTSVHDASMKELLAMQRSH